MKKLFFALAFIAAALTSCMTEQTLKYDGANSVNVSIGVEAPELNDTRSNETNMNSGLGAIDNFSDDEWAQYDLRYIFEVYDVTPGYDNLDKPIKERIVKTYDEYESTSFDLRLIPNRKYKFVVWADFVKHGSDEDLNYNTANLKNITRIGNVSPMEEALDAYFIQKSILVEGELKEKFVLTRPFGKIRVVATDINEVNLDSTPSRIAIKFYNHPTFTSLNALTGKADTETKEVTYNYTIEKGKPYTAGYDAMSSNQTLFADYIFSQTGNDGAQEVNFTMSIFDQNDRVIREHDFNTQIPLERNYLTTIIGNLLTTETEFEIFIDDNFEGEYLYNPEAKQLATPEVNTAVNGNVVTLSWNAVENADFYTVSYNDTTVTTTENEATLSLNWGETTAITVQAFSNNATAHRASEPCEVFVTIYAKECTIYFKALNPEMEDVRIFFWDLNGNNPSWPGVFMNKEYNDEGCNVFSYTFGEQYYGMTLNFLFNNGLTGDGNQTVDLSCTLDQDHYFEYYLTANNTIENDKLGYKIYAINDNGWDSMNIWLWDNNSNTLTDNKSWPGDVMKKEIVDGVEYFAYTLSEDVTDYNIVFSTNYGSPQSVDCTGYVANRDRYFHILSDTSESGTYLVEETTKTNVPEQPIIIHDATYDTISFSINIEGSYIFHCIDKETIEYYNVTPEEYISTFSGIRHEGAITIDWVDNSYFGEYMMNVREDNDYYVIVAILDSYNKVGDIFYETIHTPERPESSQNVTTELTDVTSTSVNIKTIPDADIVNYYILVRDKSWTDNIYNNYGESMLASLITHPSAGSWQLKGENEGVWDGLSPNTEYVCLILAFDSEDSKALKLIPFNTLSE